jgi:diaminopimelate epimerase
MQLSFLKYHGSGNDFIIADNRNGQFAPGNRVLISQLCHRNFGIGADGLMLLESSPEYDFHMRYFNSDGLEGSLCGNGGRCIVHFARETGIISDKAVFSASDGIHQAVIGEGDLVSLRLHDVGSPGRDGDAYITDTGSPHYVVFTANIEELDVFGEGQKIRYSEKYRDKGINVNFAEPSGNRILVRTYERGVENETLACGTGSVAVAICNSYREGEGSKKTMIQTRGGLLEVSFEKTGGPAFKNIWLTGPARMVYRGTIDTGQIMDTPET